MGVDGDLAATPPPPLSGVATLEESSDEAFAVGDEVVITMHVNIPDVEPVLTKLKSVVVELAGTGVSHTLFQDYGVTEKGVANNLEHFASDDTTDSTTFRLTELAMGMPAADPVFASSASESAAYTIYSTATVEYQTNSGRRLGEVSTFRAGPARRGLGNTAEVDVVATNVVNVAASSQGDSTNTTPQQTTAPASGSSSSTVVIIAVGAFVGAAFVMAGAVFLIKSRCMHTRVQRSKSKFYTSKPAAMAQNPMAKAPAVASLDDLNTALAKSKARPVAADAAAPAAALPGAAAAASAPASPTASSDDAAATSPAVVSRNGRTVRKVRRVRRKLKSSGSSGASGSAAGSVVGSVASSTDSAVASVVSAGADSAVTAGSGASASSTGSKRRVKRVVRKKKVVRSAPSSAPTAI